MTIRDNTRIAERGYEVLRSRLPPGWKAEIVKQFGEVDEFLLITGPDQSRISMAVASRSSIEPRQAIEIATSFRGVPCLVIAPYLSPSTRERLAKADVNFLDLTGNARVVTSRPGLYIDTGGADVDPDSVPRPSRSLRGSKAGRVVRNLVDRRTPGGVREIASEAGVDPGYVSRVLSLLDREAVIERKGRGKVSSVDWPRLLRRWAEDAPLESRGKQFTCLDPRGGSALLQRLAELDRGSTLVPISESEARRRPRYSVTGSFVASKFAPVAAARLLTIYVADADLAIRDLGLRRADTGANVLLIEPEDDGVFVGAQKDGDVRYVAVSQAAADLLGSTGRGPAEGEALVEWMKEHEEEWRG